MGKLGSITFKGGSFDEETGNIVMVVDSVDLEPGDTVSFPPDFFNHPRLFGKGRENSPIVGELRRINETLSNINKQITPMYKVGQFGVRKV